MAQAPTTLLKKRVLPPPQSEVVNPTVTTPLPPTAPALKIPPLRPGKEIDMLLLTRRRLGRERNSIPILNPSWSERRAKWKRGCIPRGKPSGKRQKRQQPLRRRPRGRRLHLLDRPVMGQRSCDVIERLLTQCINDEGNDICNENMTSTDEYRRDDDLYNKKARPTDAQNPSSARDSLTAQ